MAYKLLGPGVCRAPLTFRIVHYMSMSLLHLWLAFSILWLLLFPFHSNLFLTFRGREVIDLPLPLIYSLPPSISITQVSLLSLSLALLQLLQSLSHFPTTLANSCLSISHLLCSSCVQLWHSGLDDFQHLSIKHLISQIAVFIPSVPLARINFLSAVPFLF